MGFPKGSADREELLQQLGKHYVINDLGEVKFSLGLCVQQDLRLRAAAVHQRPLIEEIARTYEQDILRLPSTSRTTPYGPLAHGDMTLLDPTTRESHNWQNKCLQLAGKINYIAVGSRPDVAGALSMSMQLVSRASEDVYTAILHIARYLKDTANYAIHYSPQTPLTFSQNIIDHCSSIPSTMAWQEN